MNTLHEQLGRKDAAKFGLDHGLEAAREVHRALAVGFHTLCVLNPDLVQKVMDRCDTSPHDYPTALAAFWAYTDGWGSTLELRAPKGVTI